MASNGGGSGGRNFDNLPLVLDSDQIHNFKFIFVTASSPAFCFQLDLKIFVLKEDFIALNYYA